MKTLSTLLIAIVLFSCNTRNVAKSNTHEDQIKKETVHLAQVKFTNAIQFYGEPQVSNKLKVGKDHLSKEQLQLVNKYFPNKEYESKKVFFLEAQWKRPKNTELTVWYIFIENEWKPIEVSTKV